MCTFVNWSKFTTSRFPFTTPERDEREAEQTVRPLGEQSAAKGRTQAKYAWQKTATASRMMPLMFTTVLHKGFSEVSVIISFMAASSSFVILGPFCWSRPQNRS